MKLDIWAKLILGLGVVIVLALIAFLYTIFNGTKGHVALDVGVFHGKASVTIDGKEFGETPVYTEKLFSKDLKVVLNNESRAYNATVHPMAGTAGSIMRDLGVNDYFSSGYNVWFENTGGDGVVSVVSPSLEKVSVIVDGVEVGKTPIRFATKDLLSESDDGQYDVTFSKEGYESMAVRISVDKGRTLNISVDMFLIPIPKVVEDLKLLGDTGGVFLDFSKVQGSAFVDKQSWAKAVNYWLDTRDVTKISSMNISKLDYFIDSEGKVYNDQGNEIKPSEINFGNNVAVAYLGTVDNNGLTDSAKDVVKEVIGKVLPSGPVKQKLGQVKVKDTGIGHLNIRSGPGVSNGKVGQVVVGKVFSVLEKKNGWSKIEYGKDKTGWAIDKYLSIVE